MDSAVIISSVSKESFHSSLFHFVSYSLTNTADLNVVKTFSFKNYWGFVPIAIFVGYLQSSVLN